jgi:hypothetical protein
MSISPTVPMSNRSPSCRVAGGGRPCPAATRTQPAAPQPAARRPCGTTPSPRPGVARRAAGPAAPGVERPGLTRLVGNRLPRPFPPVFRRERQTDRQTDEYAADNTQHEPDNDQHDLSFDRGEGPRSTRHPRANRVEVGSPAAGFPYPPTSPPATLVPLPLPRAVGFLAGGSRGAEHDVRSRR